MLKDDVPEDCEIGSAEFKRYLQVSNPGDYTQYEALENSVLQHKAELEALQQPYADVNKAQAEFQKADNNLAHAEQDKVSLEAQKLNLENEKTAWDAGHPDKYLELMAYWDMLESFGKSHQFTLASKNMRNKFLDNSHGPSKAQQVTEQFLEAYRNKYGMVA